MTVPSMHHERISNKEIRDRVEETRIKYAKEFDLLNIPIDVELFAEKVLKIDIVPKAHLRRDHGADALLSIDRKKIYVDLEEYEDDRYESRMRFSIAHELGHFFLHNNTYEQQMNIENRGEYFKYIENFSDEEWKWFESQANEFAGRLLVPLDLLEREIEKCKKIARVKGIPEDYLNNMDTDEFATLAIPQMTRVFGVSDQVLERRIAREFK